MADLDELADALYAVPPADFVAARKDAVAAARAVGDKAVATQLAALKKPTVAAWLVNQLVREQSDDIEAAIGLGAEMRDATVAGDREALRELSTRRAQIVSRLVDRARVIADGHDQAITAETQREVEQTITAAAIDPAAAEQLRAGRLTAALTSEGFGFDQGALPPPQDRSSAPRVTTQPTKQRVTREPEATIVIPSRRRAKATTATEAEPGTVSRREDPAAKATEAAEGARARAVEEAEQALAVARLQQADADAELADAQRVLEEAARTESEAQAAYQRAQSELADARADVRDATKDVTAANRAVVAALAKLEKVTRPKR
jgi:hypothetical protein